MYVWCIAQPGVRNTCGCGKGESRRKALLSEFISMVEWLVRYHSFVCSFFFSLFSSFPVSRERERALEFDFFLHWTLHCAQENVHECSESNSLLFSFSSLFLLPSPSPVLFRSNAKKIFPRVPIRMLNFHIMCMYVSGVCNAIAIYLILCAQR